MLTTPFTLTAFTAMPTTRDLARQLIQASNSRHPIDATVASGPVDAAQAYAVQQAVWRELSPDARPTAWKVGAPNRQTEATAAAVLPQRTRFSPVRFSGETFRTLGIEAEIAFCFGRDLPARTEAYSQEEILAAIASAHVAMELVDTRLADPEAAGPLWRLADSLLNGGLVLGEAIMNWRELDLSGLSVRSLADAHCLAESIGRPPLDDLLHCLPWWINHIGGAQAGDIVTTGAWHGMHRVHLPASVEVEFVGVGSVGARIG